jgi:chaperonin GroEL
MGRYALLVATGEYDDPFFEKLRGPAQDVLGLRRVLLDASIGGFDEVTVLENAPVDKIRADIDDILADKTHEDLVLVYFSCHGKLDLHKELYFIAKATKNNRLPSSALEAAYVEKLMSHSHAGGKLLVLDCCQSGAFPFGCTRSGLGRPLDGRFKEHQGYVLLAACDEFEYAFESDNRVPAISAPRPSYYTGALIAGLESGDADRNDDGFVDASELHLYLVNTVKTRTSEQTPQIRSSGLQAEFIVSRVPPLARKAPENQGATSEEAERYWRAIRDSQDPRDFEAFLATWPAEQYIDEAQRKLAELVR